MLAVQCKRNAADGTHVAGNVLALLTIASRGGQRKFTVGIGERHGQSINLEFGHDGRGGIAKCIRQAPLAAGIPLAYVVCIESVRKRKERFGVGVLLKRIKRIEPNALRGRVVVLQRRKARLDAL